MGDTNGRHEWETGDIDTGFRWEELRERDQLEDPGVDERIILKWILKLFMPCINKDFTQQMH